MINHQKMGSRIKSFVKQFPSVSIGSNIQPITRTVLRVRLMIAADFMWNDKMHGTVHEPWWIWVEDPDNDHIYHSEYFLLMKHQVSVGVVSKEIEQLSTILSEGKQIADMHIS